MSFLKLGRRSYGQVEKSVGVAVVLPDDASVNLRTGDLPSNYMQLGYTPPSELPHRRLVALTGVSEKASYTKIAEGANVIAKLLSSHRGVHELNDDFVGPIIKDTLFERGVGGLAIVHCGISQNKDPTREASQRIVTLVQSLGCVESIKSYGDPNLNIVLSVDSANWYVAKS